MSDKQQNCRKTSTWSKKNQPDNGQSQDVKPKRVRLNRSHLFPQARSQLSDVGKETNKTDDEMELFVKALEELRLDDSVETHLETAALTRALVSARTVTCGMQLRNYCAGVVSSEEGEPNPVLPIVPNLSEVSGPLLGDGEGTAIGLNTASGQLSDVGKETNKTDDEMELFVKALEELRLDDSVETHLETAGKFK
ncbi:hypothetical protein KOW79_008484 [Hemibagrus wyckioides]|uniref:Uncharacterized protein n=1 Tax=Hemibagrus wyckioides TaxID=337641 RepID=A0A9D3NTT4_9TELE|nr:hypothetical protein KOW79_008484 [Hemibagrus wyckioides]